ncbi:hypothetical protein [Singulisphaera sp. PoT]|uniref:hypothetical protein n=1 Tax=Singulisphaera sp. PoT TaxID=3411797 RepID=UPI003BF5F983
MQLSLRIRLACFQALAVLFVGSRAPADEVPVKSLALSPSPAPVPALRHRLLPLEAELNPGDAAPIYLRLNAENSPEGLKILAEKPHALLALPFDQFPTTEARKLVDQWRVRLAQIEYGAHRQTCNWNYTIPEEREHVIDILLPDAQSLRNWARLVALKARVEIAEGKHDEALRTIQTGLALSRHLGEGPFLINTLVGIASASMMLDRIEELVERPGAPNLYWTLTALPSPLIPIRRAVTYEYKMCEWLLPEMTDLDRPRTGAEWTARLARFHGRILKTVAAYQIEDDATPKELDKFREWVLPESRDDLKSKLGKLDGLHDDQMILMFYGMRYRDLYDEVYKATYLPIHEAQKVYTQGKSQLRAVKQGPLRLFSSLIANVETGHSSEAIADRRIAALRVVEALRLHGAVAGRLPKSLDEVDVVPLPNDPITGRKFDYRQTAEASILFSPPPNGIAKLGLTYRINLRK